MWNNRILGAPALALLAVPASVGAQRGVEKEPGDRLEHPVHVFPNDSRHVGQPKPEGGPAA